MQQWQEAAYQQHFPPRSPPLMILAIAVWTKCGSNSSYRFIDLELYVCVGLHIYVYICQAAVLLALALAK